MSSRTAGAFLGSPYQKVEYLIGRENGTTKVGLVSSVAGFHGTWVHPNPGQALELNVIAVGGGGGCSNGTPADDGTSTIFGSVTANGGTGGNGSTGRVPGQYEGREISAGSGSSAVQLDNSILWFGGVYGSDSSGSLRTGGTGFISLTSSLTVTGNVDYIIGQGGLGTANRGGNGSEGGIILQYNAIN